MRNSLRDNHTIINSNTCIHKLCAGNSDTHIIVTTRISPKEIILNLENQIDLLILRKSNGDSHYSILLSVVHPSYDKNLFKDNITIRK
jgi:hypothetical protein